MVKKILVAISLINASILFAERVNKTNVSIISVGADQNGTGWLKIAPDGLRLDRCGEGYIYTTSNQILSTLLSAQSQGKTLSYLSIEDGQACMGGAPMAMTGQGCTQVGTSKCRIEFVEVK